MSDDSGGRNKSFMEKLFGSKSKENIQQETEEEILNLVEQGKELGIIESSTKSIIENIFNFDDTNASEIMTHRTDMTALDDELRLDEIVRIAIETGYSRIPVYHGDIDSIIGVLYVKDLLRYVCTDIPKDFEFKRILRPVLYVPKTKNCSKLFSEMTMKKIQLVVVVDEYGGTEGLITLEDLIEEILGNIQDEYDHEEDEYTKISENKFTLDGSMPLSDVEDLVDIKFEESGSDTIAGFILEQIGRIPKEGEPVQIVLDNVVISVTRVEDRRISEVMIEKI